MSNEVIFFTQIATLVAFVGATFGLYRLLVSQKDAVIELLRERVAQLELQVRDAEKQAPDVLAQSLSQRVETATKEIQRLKDDGQAHSKEIHEKERELFLFRSLYENLHQLFKDYALACPRCNKGPLIRREFYPIYGVAGGPEVEAEGEYLEYECGYAEKDGKQAHACKLS